LEDSEGGSVGWGWQQGFHETNVQYSKQFLFVWAYVEENQSGLA